MREGEQAPLGVVNIERESFHSDEDGSLLHCEWCMYRQGRQVHKLKIYAARFLSPKENERKSEREKVEHLFFIPFPHL